jgi:hypothetical protein
MAKTPEFKVYKDSGEYVAACKYPEDAAAIVASYGDGATIRLGHRRVIWQEGSETQPAGESYDYVYQVVMDRIRNGR